MVNLRSEVARRVALVGALAVLSAAAIITYSAAPGSPEPTAQAGAAFVAKTTGPGKTVAAKGDGLKDDKACETKCSTKKSSCSGW